MVRRKTTVCPSSPFGLWKGVRSSKPLQFGPKTIPSQTNSKKSESILLYAFPTSNLTTNPYSSFPVFLSMHPFAISTLSKHICPHYAREHLHKLIGSIFVILLYGPSTMLMGVKSVTTSADSFWNEGCCYVGFYFEFLE